MPVTPGNWRVEFEEDGGYDSLYAAYNIYSDAREGENADCPIASVDLRDYVQSTDYNNTVEEWRIQHSENAEAAANAQLFAASKEMLEALKHVALLLNGTGYRATESAERADVAREVAAAIARAEGRA